MKRVLLAAALAAAAAVAWTPPQRFTFVILGDRTGDAQPGVYEQVWKEAAREHPAFVVNTGDSIQGLKDADAARQWAEVARIWQPYRKLPLYLVPGNHDIWSDASERLYRQYARHAPRYSFEYRQAHFTVLDNSRGDALSDEDLAFLEADLKAHAAAPVKFVLMHRPSWILNAVLRNTDFPLHRMAKQYGVQYVIAGHVHQILRFDLDGITYLSMPSSGGHLRLSKAYEAGWFFGHAKVDVNGREIDFTVEESNAPHGEGRRSKPADWGAVGLIQH